MSAVIGPIGVTVDDDDTFTRVLHPSLDRLDDMVTDSDRIMMPGTSDEYDHLTNPVSMVRS